MQVKKQQLELDSSTVRTGFKLAKEYVKAAFCHSAYLTYMQSTWCKMPGWMKHKLESRLQGEISNNLRYADESEVTQLCLIIGDSMDCSLTGSSIHEIFHLRVLEWVAISFSRGSSQPRDRIQVSRIVGRRFTVWASREVLYADDTTLKPKSEEELKSLLMRLKNLA